MHLPPKETELEPMMNYRTWAVAAEDDNGQPFLFPAYAQDREGAIKECEADLPGLRVTAVEPA